MRKNHQRMHRRSMSHPTITESKFIDAIIYIERNEDDPSMLSQLSPFPNSNVYDKTTARRAKSDVGIENSDANRRFNNSKHFFSPRQKKSTTPISHGFCQSPLYNPSVEQSFCGADIADIFEEIGDILGGDELDGAASVHSAASHATPNQELPDFRLAANEMEAAVAKEKHFSIFAFGKWLTMASIIFALAALTLSIFSRKSLKFVKMRNLVEISPQLNLVQDVGLYQMNLCYNETGVGANSRRISELEDIYLSRYLSYEQTLDRDEGNPENHNSLRGCFILNLTLEIVKDFVWNVSRAFLSLAIVSGSFLALMLCLSIYWESINLKPVALGLLLTYFFQSISFFFFDSELCRKYGCEMNEGSFVSVASCFCWFLSGLCCIRMDICYQTEKRRRLRRRKRALRKLKLHRMVSGGTALSTPAHIDDRRRSLGKALSPRNLQDSFDAESQYWCAANASDVSSDGNTTPNGRLYDV
jgi:hypothetical protein